MNFLTIHFRSVRSERLVNIAAGPVIRGLRRIGRGENGKSYVMLFINKAL
jgi:hypothetical protein